MALIRRLPVEPNLNFMGRRALFLLIALAIVVASAGLFLTKGLNLGFDFRWGILIDVRTAQPADLGIEFGLRHAFYSAQDERFSEFQG